VGERQQEASIANTTVRLARTGISPRPSATRPAPAARRSIAKGSFWAGTLLSRPDSRIDTRAESYSVMLGGRVSVGKAPMLDCACAVICVTARSTLAAPKVYGLRRPYWTIHMSQCLEDLNDSGRSRKLPDARGARERSSFGPGEWHRATCGDPDSVRAFTVSNG
jgi:hypothetical protein